ncbi:MAG: hypothetical protein IPK26_25080 [Planctomycetes bacterium]|nr:hypothetical protein [Planctomycetota bacterium]
MPPGAPLSGRLTLAPNQSGAIEAFTAAFAESRCEDELHLMLEADVDGDGLPETLASARIVDSVPALAGAGVATATAAVAWRSTSRVRR